MAGFNSKDRLDRRIFLKKLIKYFFLALSFLLSIFTLINLTPPNPKKKSYKFYEIEEDKIPTEGVRKISTRIDESGKTVVFFVVRHDNSLIALSPYCTHLGCIVNFDRNLNEFLCPCHQGRYDINGKVLSGPPKEPLNRLPVKIENGKFLVGIAI